jgi:S1-C subfamily serine protease
MVAAVAVLVVAAGGGLGSRTTVTVQETPIVSAPTSRAGAGLSARAIYRRTAQGIVFVNASDASSPQSPGELLRGEGGQQSTATGSGFEIDGKGTIMTNWHVVEGASSVTVGLLGGRTVHARVTGEDPTHDLALLRIPTAGVTLHPLSLGDSRLVRVGDPVFAIGNPFGLGGTLTSGIVSAVGRRIKAPSGASIGGALQTDAPINPGNSGGPLLNERGEVVGITSQIETSGSNGGSVGIAFAIPIETVTGSL